MSVAGVQLSPNMSYQQLIAALNQNFALFTNNAQTQTITDTTGTPRIIIGQLPDGNFGIVVSKPGVDVIKLFQ